MIVDKIQEYIGDHSAPGVLFVIKGYAFTEFESCATSLGKTIEDKGSRFMEILQQPTKVICYEEFICLREIILSMFSKIYIFENKDYINLFPVRVCIQPEIMSALCAHYDEELQEEQNNGHDKNDNDNLYKYAHDSGYLSGGRHIQKYTENVQGQKRDNYRTDHDIDDVFEIFHDIFQAVTRNDRHTQTQRKC